MSFRLLILILFLILPASWASAAQDVWTGVEKIVAVGDVHGDYRQFVTLLEDAGLIDRNQKWIGGKTHLVQTGDVLDRGPESRKVMDLLVRLEEQARKAGGYVHALIGNHEAMNIYGDLRYVSPQEYEAFRDRNSGKIRASFYEQHIEETTKSLPPEELPELDEAYRRDWESRHPLGFFEHRFHFGPNGKHGKWILGHNAVIKINGTIFLHGGVSPKYANDSIRQINERVREELMDFSKLAGGIVMEEEGPLWYRGLALGDEESLTPHLEMVLSNNDARRIVVGHTVTGGAVMSRFGGRVILIDVGLSAFYGGRLACLIIEKDRTYALHRGRKLELPS
ncbi:MAG: metallophosphoesterase, partial [Acidobacteria bacterium]|nr:metallophosphoesterase [Acidobacteriota bacterium]